MDLDTCTLRRRKQRVTRKLAPQFTATAISCALPRAFVPNISVTKNQGIDPGPVANMTTNK